MAGPSDARDRVLDAYQELLITTGERSATLEAVAHGASISKGGLLYHFASKDALTEGMVARMRALAEADVYSLRSAPEGVVRRFLRSSVSTGSPLDRAILATTKLAQSANPRARDALAELQRNWHAAVLDEVEDATLAQAIMLLSDGIYFNSALFEGTFGAAGQPSPRELDELLDLVDRMVEDRGTR